MKKASAVKNAVSEEGKMTKKEMGARIKIYEKTLEKIKRIAGSNPEDCEKLVADGILADGGKLQMAATMHTV